MRANERLAREYTPPASADVDAAREAHPYVACPHGGCSLAANHHNLARREAAIRAEAGTLDVERLAQTYDNLVESWAHGEGDFWAAFAAEYARLAEAER